MCKTIPTPGNPTKSVGDAPTVIGDDQTGQLAASPKPAL